MSSKFSNYYSTTRYSIWNKKIVRIDVIRVLKKGQLSGFSQSRQRERERIAEFDKFHRFQVHYTRTFWFIVQFPLPNRSSTNVSLIWLNARTTIHHGFISNILSSSSSSLLVSPRIVELIHFKKTHLERVKWLSYLGYVIIRCVFLLCV